MRLGTGRSLRSARAVRKRSFSLRQSFFACSARGFSGDSYTHRVLTHYLREWHKQTPYAKPTDFVFPSIKESGRVPICASAFCADHLRPAAKKAGVVIPDGHRWGLHNLRHSLSNWLVTKAKENPKTVQGILGHARIQTTLDLYTDEDLDEMIAAQEKFLDAVGFESGSVQ